MKRKKLKWESNPVFRQTIHQIVFTLTNGYDNNYHQVIVDLIHQTIPGITQLDLVAIGHAGKLFRFYPRHQQTFGKTLFKQFSDTVIQLVPLFKS